MTEQLQTEMTKRTWQRSGTLEALTVERALYVGLALVALVLRLYALGQRPMQPDEAQQALAAWRLLQGEHAGVEGSSPLMLTGNLILFALLGANDATARLLPALLGTALVILPYGLRRWLGRSGALSASAILSLSPVSAFDARYLSGVTAVGVSVLLFLIGVSHWVEGRQRQAAYWGTAGLAGLLLADASGYTMLLILASFAAILWIAARTRATQERKQDTPARWSFMGFVSPRAGEDGYEALRRSVVPFALTVGFISTCALLNPGGLEAALDLLPAWVRRFAVSAGGLDWFEYLALLPLYEPLTLVAGVAGLALAWCRRESFGVFLGYWAVSALVISLPMAGKGASDILLVVVPLALLGGRFLGHYLPRWLKTCHWQQTALSMALACVLAIHAWLQLTFFGLNGDTAYALAAALMSLLVVGLFVAVAHWLGTGVTYQAAGLFGLLALGLTTASAGIQLNLVHVGDPHELVLAAPTSAGVHTLLGDVAHLSQERAIDRRAVDVVLHENAALPLVWYLRDYPNVRTVETLGATIASTAVIAPAADAAPELGGPYYGQDYTVRSSWSLKTLRGADWGAWLLRRQSSTRPEEERVILWVRQEER